MENSLLICAILKIWKAKSSSQKGAFFYPMFVNWARVNEPTSVVHVFECHFFHQIVAKLPQNAIERVRIFKTKKSLHQERQYLSAMRFSVGAEIVFSDQNNSIFLMSKFYCINWYKSKTVKNCTYAIFQKPPNGSQKGYSPLWVNKFSLKTRDTFAFMCVAQHVGKRKRKDFEIIKLF